MSNFIANLKIILEKENISLDKLGNLLAIKKQDLYSYLDGKQEFSLKEKNKIALFLGIDLKKLEEEKLDIVEKLVEKRFYKFINISYLTLFYLIAMVLTWTFSKIFNYILLIASIISIVAICLEIFRVKPIILKLKENEKIYLERNSGNNIIVICSIFWLLCLMLFSLFYLPNIYAILAFLCFLISLGSVCYYLLLSLYERIEKVSLWSNLILLLPFLFINVGIGILISTFELELWLLILVMIVNLFLILSETYMIFNLSKYKVIVINEKNLEKRYVNI